MRGQVGEPVDRKLNRVVSLRATFTCGEIERLFGGAMLSGQCVGEFLVIGAPR